jgi:peptidoglycan/xylan/chitin deacetylase (PgdA/CDA1 family)
MTWAVRGKSSAVFAPSIWRCHPGRKAVALTFDDGPSEGTGQILDILARYRVPATFFQIGANVDRLPDVARAVGQAGHQIGNHSYSHPLFCFRTPGFLEHDLARAQDAIERHAGVRPECFRAPFGVRWFGMRAAQRRLGLMGVMWSAIGYDWSRNSDEVVARVTSGIGQGAILCLHDGRELRARPDIGVTVEAVRRIVPLLLDRGYQLETVSRLQCPTN